MMSVSRLSWKFENEASEARFVRIAGVDEAGRGCLAGPVVAAALIFPDHSAWPDGLNDSKKLNRKSRGHLFEELVILPGVVFSVGMATVGEIDRINILQAALLAMRRAVAGLPQEPDFLLVDGNILPDKSKAGRAVVSGDGLSPSIAAASILAKESRDRMMEQLDQQYPGYGFAQHKGYGTAAHLRALEAQGPCPEHRRSFAPVAQLSLALPE
jgi:ribonuclease HII